MGALVGYARVSTRDQDPAVQVDALTEAGAVRVFTDHGASSRSATRPQWLACLDYLRAGDVLLVWRLDRLAGSEKMAIDTLADLDARGIELRSLTEPAIDTTTPMGRALYGLVAVFAQLRVDTIRENTRAGLARARAAGRVGGRPTVMSPQRVAQAQAMHADGHSLAEIAATLGVGYGTIQRTLATPAPT